MNFRLVRSELRKMGRKNLFKMLMSQKESRCILNGLCSFHFEYKGYTFCLSEVLGEGCEPQRLEKLEKETCEREEGQSHRENVEVPLFDCSRRASYNLIRVEDD